RADRELAADRVLTADVQDREDGDAHDEADRWPDEALHPGQRHGAAEVLTINAREVIRLGALLRERLHDADAREVLLRLRGHVAELCLQTLEADVNGAADVPEGDRGERH